MDENEMNHINDILNEESIVRDKIKDQVTELDAKTRLVLRLLNRVHVTPVASLPGLADSVRPLISECQPIMTAISDAVPPLQFWRFKDMWTFPIRNAVFAIVLLEYITSHKLASVDQVSEALGIKNEWSGRLELAVEDYLHGLISVVNELSRLAINSVTMGEYQEPLKISMYVKDIFAGFSLLNLKNDALRKRYDSLKYDIKKVEEVVYDVSLRNLNAPSKSVGDTPV